MQRRDFIHKSLLLGTGLLTLPNLLLARTERAAASPKVVIVGAGIAGIACALRLAQAGIQATILEAQNRAGGRIVTDRSTGIPMDLGAGWIHGPDGNNPITPLARKANARLFVTDDDSLEVFNTQGQAIADALIESSEQAYNELLAEVERRAQALPADLSIRDIIAQTDAEKLDDPLWVWMMTSYTEFDFGGPIERLSAKYFTNDEVFPGNDVIFPDGYDVLIQSLVDPIADRIRYNKAVSQAEYAPAEGVRLTTRDGEKIEADYAVITVPLGVLKKQVINFAPALDAERLALWNRIETGAVNKVFLVWDEAFWDPKTQYIGYTDPVKGKFTYFLNYRTFSDANVLVTFGFGNYGFELEKLSDAQIQSQVMQTLRTIYGNDIPEPKRMVVTRWSQNPYSYGAYSYPTVGMNEDDFDQMGEPVANRLLFAGEHTITQYRGTVHGAYLTGIREAERILRWENVSRHPFAGSRLPLACYPNPASGDEVSLRAEIPAGIQAEAILFDPAGKRIRTVNLKAGNPPVIPIHGLASGYYTVNLLLNGASAGTTVLWIR